MTPVQRSATTTRHGACHAFHPLWVAELAPSSTFCWHSRQPRCEPSQ